jgi:triosephosphate isomerase
MFFDKKTEAPQQGRRPMMAGNWKMNKTIPEAVALSQRLCNHYVGVWDKVDIVLCPPACDLKAVWTVIDFDKTEIAVGAQNVHWEPSGAYTGEISVEMIKEIGCAYCIVGHSERREYFAETDEQVNLKVKALVPAGIVPIICVGESLNIREAGNHLEFITAQVRMAYAGLDADEAVKTVVAYEPIWAIGTGRTATPEASG